MCTFTQSVGIAGGRSSSSNYFVGSQADNLFYLDPHHTLATVPLRPPTQTQTTDRIGSVESRSGSPRLRGDQYKPPPPSRHRSPTSPASGCTGSSTFSYPTAGPSPLSKQLSTKSSSSGRAYVRWKSAGANGGGWRLVLSGEAVGGPGLDATQVHYVTSHTTSKLRMCH